MKVLLTTDTYAPAVNGVVTSVLNLRRALQAQGHSVRVLTLSGDRHTTRRDGVLALGSLDAGLIYPGVRLRRPTVGRAVQELIAWRPDIVHSQCEFSTFPLARHIARACGAPLVHTYHTVYEEYTHYFSPSRRCGRWMARAFTRRVAQCTDAVVAPTAKIAALLHSYRVGVPVRVLPTGIELQAFACPPLAAAQAALRAALGLEPGKLVLVYVGRLAREKNIDELLECRAALGPAEVTLLLVGDGPDAPRLKRRAAALGLGPGAVAFAGMAPPEQVAAYYRLGDVFVSASGSETQGLTYLEALACGLPCVCREDACLDGVICDGLNGWQYRTPADLLARVQTLLDDRPLRCAMGLRAAQSAQCWSAQAFGQGAASLYRELLLRRAEQRPAAVPAAGALRCRRA